MNARLLGSGLFAAALVLSGAFPAAAHGDSQVVAGEVTLEPGQSITFGGEIHYHRLVGNVEADGPVSVQLVAVGSGETVFQSGPAPMLRFNHLVRCCTDTAWAPHFLTVTNPGTRPVRGMVDAALVHDDLAVMAFRAESGIVESVVVMALLWGVVMWRVFRRPERTVPFPTAVKWALGTIGGVVVLGLFGAVRYGTPGPPALVAALADVPAIPMNPVLSRASLLIGTTMVAWAVSASHWARSRTLAPPAAWTLLGFGLVASPATTVALMAVSYEPVEIPVAMGLVAAVPLLAVLVAGGLGQMSVGVTDAPERKRK